jgi:hypothetical protein
MPIVEDAGSIVVNASLDDIPFVNIFGFRLEDPLEEAGANAIAGVLDDAYGELTGALSDRWLLNNYVVTDLRTADGPQFLVDSDVNGDDGANPLPFQTAALISWKTSRRGRSFRGRTYIGGFCEDHSDGRQLSTDLKNALEDFTGHVEGAGYFGVISLFEPNPSPPPSSVARDPGILTLISSHSVHGFWRTQRRRALLSD